MNITTKRIKEIIMEEVKALAEAGDYHDFGDPAELEDVSNQPRGLDDEQIEADIQEMLNTLDLTDDQRNTLETIQHHILGGRMGIDDMPMRNAPFADRDEDGNRTLNKEDIARIIHEETVKAIKEDRFTGGQIDIDPLSDEEHEASTDAYYALFDFLIDSELPGSKPSEKLKYALRWIAKFEQEGEAERAHLSKLKDAGVMGRFVRGLKEGVVDMDGETVITGPDGDASPEAQGLARQDDLQASMMKAALEIKNKKFEKAYETLLRALAAAGIEGGEALPGLEGGEELEERHYGGAYSKSRYAPRKKGEPGEQSANTGSRQKDSSTERPKPSRASRYGRG